jgi:hypothetical protein
MSSLTCHPEYLRMRELGFCEEASLLGARHAEELDEQVRREGLRVHRAPKASSVPKEPLEKRTGRGATVRAYDAPRGPKGAYHKTPAEFVAWSARARDLACQRTMLDPAEIRDTNVLAVRTRRIWWATLSFLGCKNIVIARELHYSPSTTWLGWLELDGQDRAAAQEFADRVRRQSA